MQKDDSFINSLLEQFRHVPGLSDISNKATVSIGMGDNVAFVSPLISMGLFLFAGVIFFTILNSLFAKTNAANARFASFSEIFRSYTIPSVVSTYFFSACFSLFVILWIDASFGIKFKKLSVFVLSVISMLIIHAIRGSYPKIRRSVQPYPLGRYKGINLYLTGGHRFSFIRGHIKEQRQGHIIAMGPSSSGKTTKIFIPGLLEDATNNCSAIVVEVKASAQEDMFKMIAPTWAAAGKKIVLFDPWGDPAGVTVSVPDPNKGIIKSIDAKAGTVVFCPRGDGKEVTLKVDKDIALAKVKAGDKVEADIEYNVLMNVTAIEDISPGTPAATAPKEKEPVLKQPGLSFNPLIGLNPSFSDPVTRDTIEDIVDAIYRTYETERGAIDGNASYYADQELSLLKGLLTIALFKPRAERNLAAVAEVVNGTLEDVIGYIESTMKMTSTPDEVVRDIGRSLKWFTHPDNLHETQRAGTLRGVAGKLAIFTHPRVRDFVVNDQLNLDMVFKEPTLFCIKAPLNEPGSSTLASIIIRLLMSRVPNKLAYGAGADFKVFFYLDELPALSIPKFDQFCKTARSSGTGIIAAIQDRSDMAEIIRAKLGINSIDGLLGNFKTQYLLPGLQPGTTHHYSMAFGYREVKVKEVSKTTGAKNQTSRSSSVQEKLLIQPDQIKHMPLDKCIIVDMNHRPFMATAVPWYKSRTYQRLVKRNRDVELKLTAKRTKLVKYKPPTLGNYDFTDQAKERRGPEKRDPGLSIEAIQGCIPSSPNTSSPAPDNDLLEAATLSAEAANLSPAGASNDVKSFESNEVELPNYSAGSGEIKEKISDAIHAKKRKRITEGDGIGEAPLL